MAEHSNSAGRIVFLNGASCSGKTTIAHALQDMLEEPYLHVSVDNFLRMLPNRYRDWSKPESFRAVYKAVSGMHHSVAALVAAGNHVIVDTVLVNTDNLAECAYIFAHLRVTFVGVFCPLAELERRALVRGDREVGVLKSQFEQVHAYKIYDVEVDTSLESAQHIARKIKAYHERVLWPQALRQIRNEKITVSD